MNRPDGLPITFHFQFNSIDYSCWWSDDFINYEEAKKYQLNDINETFIQNKSDEPLHDLKMDKNFFIIELNIKKESKAMEWLSHWFDLYKREYLDEQSK